MEEKKESKNLEKQLNNVLGKQISDHKNGILDFLMANDVQFSEEADVFSATVKLTNIESYQKAEQRTLTEQNNIRMKWNGETEEASNRSFKLGEIDAKDKWERFIEEQEKSLSFEVSNGEQLLRIHQKSVEVGELSERKKKELNELKRVKSIFNASSSEFKKAVYKLICENHAKNNTPQPQLISKLFGIIKSVLLDQQSKENLAEGKSEQYLNTIQKGESLEDADIQAVKKLVGIKDKMDQERQKQLKKEDKIHLWKNNSFEPAFLNRQQRRNEQKQKSLGNIKNITINSQNISNSKDEATTTQDSSSVNEKTTQSSKVIEQLTGNTITAPIDYIQFSTPSPKSCHNPFRVDNLYNKVYTPSQTSSTKHKDTLKKTNNIMSSDTSCNTKTSRRFIQASDIQQEYSTFISSSSLSVRKPVERYVQQQQESRSSSLEKVYPLQAELMGNQPLHNMGSKQLLRYYDSLQIRINSHCPSPFLVE